MNILFFLTPKAMCTWLDENFTLRQAMEKMESSGFSALPVLNRDNGYVSVITEGDLLRALRRICVMDLRQTEEHSLREITPRRQVYPVKVDANIEDLVLMAAGQNFVPVTDDAGSFIGIVTRSRILQYCAEKALLKS